MARAGSFSDSESRAIRAVIFVALSIVLSKALISFADIAKLICAFVFVYTKYVYLFSHDAARMYYNMDHYRYLKLCEN